MEKSGHYSPLHMVSASISGANTIAVVLSEAAVNDLNWLVSDVDGAGITVADRTVTNVAVSGTTMTITVAEVAAEAATVNAALTGQTSPRTDGRIPRSTIRSVAHIGQFSEDCGPHQESRMHKPLAHRPSQ